MKLQSSKHGPVKPTMKYHWDKIDEQQYQDTIITLIAECSFEVSTNNILILLTSIIRQAADTAVPHKPTKLKGPNFKLSPTVKLLELESKKAH